MKIIINNKEYDVKTCKNIFNRFKGFMFNKNIDKILCFPKCNSIHTFFMLQSISVVMTDKNFNVLYIYNSIKPWKIVSPKKGVYYTFEFKENSFTFHLNEKLNIKKNE